MDWREFLGSLTRFIDSCYFETMPRLKNPNHEKLAREYAKALAKDEPVVKTKIYQKVYKEASYDSARSTAPALLANPSIKARIDEIIAAKNPPEAIGEDLARLRRANKEVFAPDGRIVELADNPTRLGAVQTCLKVMGAFHDNTAPQDNRSITFNLNSTESNDKQGLNSGVNSGNGGFFLGINQIIEKLSALNEKLSGDSATA